MVIKCNNKVGGGKFMKVVIGSLFVIALLGFGIWLVLSPTFKKVGDSAKKIKDYLEDEEDNDGTK